MEHGVTLITTIVAGLGLAMIMGFGAARVGLPPLVGYLLAGILIGPATPGFVADVELTRQLAELGIMLMMFGVGLHFSLDDFMSVRGIAVPGALVQMAFTSSVGAAVALLWGWGVGAAVVFGLALSVASTVVVLRTLEARGLLHSVNGRIAAGWLVVEDLVVVVALVLLPPLAAPGAPTPWSWTPLGVTLAKIAGFVVIMFVLARRVLPRVLWAIARTGSRELFTLAIVSAALGVAYLSAWIFSVSFALGAFVAGMTLSESDFSHRAAQESLPLREAFSVLFFVSVGMLFQPDVLIREPVKAALVVGIVVLANPIGAIAIVSAFRYPLNTSLTVGASLAQIGEFSFVLAGLGVSLGVLSDDGQSLILAGALISMSLNPLVFAALAPVERWIRARSWIARAMERSDDPLAQLPVTVDPSAVTDHILLVGHGRVGSRIAEMLDREAIRYVVVDDNREVVEALREKGVKAVFGDAAEPAVLIQGHVARARVLVVALPDTLRARRIVAIARTLNPPIEVLLRTHTDEELELLQKEQLGSVFMGEEELAIAMARHIVAGSTRRGRLVTT
ncbi:MAG: cation:proton antiporter [Gemmatimonadales bacterium]